MSAASSFLAPNPAKSEGAAGAAGGAVDAGAGDVLVPAGASGFFPKRLAPAPNREVPAGVPDGVVDVVFSAGFPKRFGVVVAARIHTQIRFNENNIQVRTTTSRRSASKHYMR